MEWNVKNAQNRDVERQHLNKILKEIRGDYSSLVDKVGNLGSDLSQTQKEINTTVIKIINNEIPPERLITKVTLDGDVTGSSVVVPGQNAVTITTQLQVDFLSDAPNDANAYWRRGGQWEAVPASIYYLNEISGSGYAVWNEDELVWTTNQIESADDSRIVVTNGGGTDGPTTIDLAEVVPEAVGTLQLTRFDEYGRRDGEAPATTDNLAEGTTNLYYTDARTDARIELQKGQPNGIAPLDPNGLLPAEHLPPLAITETYVVNSEAAQLALDVQQGDVAVRTDINKNYIQNGGTSGTMADWTELLTPAAPVQSVNGKVGNVVLNAADVGAATAAQGALADSAVQSVSAGTGISVNNTDPRNPVISTTAIPVSNHNDLLGLQGGRPGEYYHLSKDEYDNLLLPFAYLTDEEGNQLTDEEGNYLIVDAATIDWNLLFNVPSFQPLDADLTAIAALSSTGIATRTGTDTWTLTSVASLQSLMSYTLADANALLGVNDAQMIMITDLTGGREPCWYDSTVSSGTKWRRFSDRSIAN